jgi:hypothetical protein
VEIDSSSSAIIVSCKHIKLFIENEGLEEWFIILDGNGKFVYDGEDHFEAARQFNLLCSE